MKVDRGEAQGTGLALLLHLALVAALTVNLVQAPALPEPPAMTVEFVDSDEIALTAATPSPTPSSPAAQEPAPSEPSPPATPSAQSLPQLIVPSPSAPLSRSAAQQAPARLAPSRPVPPRQSRLGDDFLAGLPDAPAAVRPPAQGAATFSAAAKASIDSAIQRQIQPCADRQAALGPGADRIRVRVNLRLDRTGRLSRPPSTEVSGLDDDNRAMGDLAENQAIAVFRACTPLRLPPELYSTPQGGWGNITMTYRAK